jgi:hypothetical protein
VETLKPNQTNKRGNYEMKQHTNPNALRARASRVSRRLDENPRYVFGVLGIFAVVVMILAQTFTRLNTASTLDRVFASTVGILGASFFVALAVAIWVGETTAETERARARKNATRLIAERDASDTAYEHLRDEYHATVADYGRTRDRLTTTQWAYETLLDRHDKLTQQRNGLSEQATELVIRLNTAERDLARATRDRDALAETAQRLTAERDAFVARDAKRAERAKRGERTFTVEIEPLFFLDERYSARVDVYGDGVTSRTALGIALSKSDTYADAVARACELLALSAHDANPYTPNA